MKIAILSAGPSLLQTYESDADYDMRIAVNAAAALRFCDWWACGDGQTFARVTPIGLPVVFTMDANDGHYRRPGVPERLAQHRVVAWSWLREQIEAPACWSNWSLTAAIALAVYHGAEHIDIYGHDRCGTTDVAGFELAKRAEHWPRVNRDTDTLIMWARERGVGVKEHHP